MRKNVLFIVIDDLRADAACLSGDVVTPHFDRLAEQGICFTRTYCQQAVCGPSRSSLMTGCQPDTTRVYDLKTKLYDVAPHLRTLPRHFLLNGYEVRGVGKIFHSRTKDDPHGWSEPVLRTEGDVYASEANRALLAEGSRGGPYECPDVPDDVYVDAFTVGTAIGMMSQLKGETTPFFLGVGIAKPHLPFNAPKRYWDLYDHESISLADNPHPSDNVPRCAFTSWGELRRYNGMPFEGPLSEAEARNLVHAYFACVSFIDAEIGRLLDALDLMKLRESTTIVVCSDHGFHLGEHGLWAKQTCFEEATRVPLFISDPELHESTGRPSAALTELIDVYPTLCELCDLQLPEYLEGSSLVRLLQDPSLGGKQGAITVCRRGTADVGYTVRTERYRFTQWQKYPAMPLSTGCELYDHESDPGENVNLVEDPAYKNRVQELRHLLVTE